MYGGSESTKRPKTEDGSDNNQRCITDKEVLCLQIAGLCHDLGLFYW